MKLIYSVNEDDFLAYQLYANSKSVILRKKRIRNRYLFSIIFIIMGFINLFFKSYIIGVGAIIYGIFRFLIYQIYSKYYLVKYLRNYIKEVYSNVINTKVELDFRDNVIASKDKFSDGNIYVKELDSLIELKKHYFLKLNTNQVLIIPKGVVDDETFFKSVIRKYNIPFIKELDWKWK